MGLNEKANAKNKTSSFLNWKVYSFCVYCDLCFKKTITMPLRLLFIAKPFYLLPHLRQPKIILIFKPWKIATNIPSNVEQKKT